MDPSASLPHLSAQVDREFVALCRDPKDRTAKAQFRDSPDLAEIKAAAKQRHGLWRGRATPSERVLRERTFDERGLLHREVLRRFTRAFDGAPGGLPAL